MLIVRQIRRLDVVLVRRVEKLDPAIRSRRDWKTFAKAIQTGTEDLARQKAKLDAADPLYQWIDLAEARSQGIMPISYSGPK